MAFTDEPDDLYGITEVSLTETTESSVPDPVMSPQEPVLDYGAADLARASADEVNEVLVQACEQLHAVLSHKARREACLAAGGANAVAVFESARHYRRSIESTYGLNTRLVGESIHSRMNLTLVAEEEEKQEAGLIRKIIDKIVAAFKWLWDKIAGLFAKGKNKDEREAKQEDSKSKVEKALKKGEAVKDKLATSNVADDSLSKYDKFFGEAGKKIGAADMVKQLDTYAATAKRTTELLDRVNILFGIFDETAGLMGEHNSPEELAGASKSLVVEFERLFELFDKVDNSEAAKVGEKTKADAVGRLGGYPNGSGLYAVKSAGKTSTTFKAKYWANNEVEKGSVIVTPSLDQLKELSEAMGRLNDAVNAASEKIATATSRNASRTDALGNHLQAASAKADGERQKAISKLLTTASSAIGSFATGALSGFTAIIAASDQVGPYITDAVSLLIKNGKGSDDKSETKPADSSEATT